MATAGDDDVRPGERDAGRATRG